jgi:hypothetical protein
LDGHVFIVNANVLHDRMERKPVYISFPDMQLRTGYNENTDLDEHIKANLKGSGIAHIKSSSLPSPALAGRVLGYPFIYYPTTDVLNASNVELVSHSIGLSGQEDTWFTEFTYPVDQAVNQGVDELVEWTEAQWKNIQSVHPHLIREFGYDKIIYRKDVHVYPAITL